MIDFKFELKRALTAWLEKMTIEIFLSEEFQQRIIMLELEEQILFSDVFFVYFAKIGKKKGINGALLMKIFESFLINQKIVWNNCVFIEFFDLMLRNGYKIGQLLANAQEWINFYFLNQSGHERSRHRLGMGLTNVPPADK